jgi:hypothetical protein
LAKTSVALKKSARVNVVFAVEEPNHCSLRKVGLNGIGEV